MKFADLISRLEHRTGLPIKPMDIVELLKEGGIQDEIRFVGVDIDPTVLRAKLIRGIETFEEQENGRTVIKTKQVAKIYYANDQTPDMKSFSIIKDLLHLLDAPITNTREKQRVVQLIESITLPSEFFSMSLALRSKDECTLQVNTDILADYRAAFVMVPLEIRTQIALKYHDKKIFLSEIADLTGLPMPYVRSILSEDWPWMCKAWLALDAQAHGIPCPPSKASYP